MGKCTFLILQPYPSSMKQNYLKSIPIYLTGLFLPKKNIDMFEICIFGGGWMTHDIVLLPFPALHS